MAELDALGEFKHGLALLNNGHPDLALPCFWRAFECEKLNPSYLSFLGLSIARAKRDWDKAGRLCEMALEINPNEAVFYLNLAEVYASGGCRAKALKTLDAGLEKFGDDDRLRGARRKVEKRRSPLIPFLSRRHFLNRELGKWLHRVSKRKGKKKT
jgi:tetratricopeptide (TPR) repeat protein